MLRLRWTGAGCLSGVIFAVFVLAGLFGGYLLARDDFKEAVLVGALGLVVGGCVNHLVALRLNSSLEDGRRAWDDRHALRVLPWPWVPMQSSTIGMFLFAGGLVAFWTSKWIGYLGWAVFIAILAAYFVLAPIGRPGPKRAVVRQMAELARTYGWRFSASEPLLPRNRWRDSLGRLPNRMGAFAVVRGERNAIPFTVLHFYTAHANSPLPGAPRDLYAVTVAHLPRAYPATAGTTRDLDFAVKVPVAYDDAFERDLLEASVLPVYHVAISGMLDPDGPAVDINFGRGGELRSWLDHGRPSLWCIAGRDLIGFTPIDAAPTAADTLDRVDTLTHIAASFPAELARRWGADVAQHPGTATLPLDPALDSATESK